MRVVAVLAGLALVVLPAFGGNSAVRRSAHPVPGRYVVVLENGANLDAVKARARTFSNAKVRHTYSGINAFAVEARDADAQVLASDARVSFVEEDAVISAATTWGLDRVDQRTLPLDGSFSPDSAGSGVTVYIVDTGIRADHSDFGMRVAPGFTAFDDSRGTNDCNGHGTHVAGIAAGTEYGVATAATLVPVRVLDCRGAGSLSTLLAGLEWILQQPHGPSVVNLSLSGDPSSALDLEVERLLYYGHTVVAAAGNDGTDACAKSPSRVRGVLTVAASTENDARASFSNFGPCVDLFAPGTNILSDSHAGPTATAVASGTSMAAPFVSGVAALAIEKYPDAAPRDIAETLRDQASAGVLADDLGAGSANRLLFSTIGELRAAASEEPGQLLGDPGFEYGTTFWSSDICTVVKPTGCPPGGELEAAAAFPSRTGDEHALVGGRAGSFQVTSETISVPSTVANLELTFHLRVVSSNPKRAVADVLHVQILDREGALLETIATFSNLDASRSWVLHRFDVTRFAGRAIRISFRGVQQQGPPTWFLIDDAALSVRAGS